MPIDERFAEEANAVEAYLRLGLGVEFSRGDVVAAFVAIHGYTQEHALIAARCLISHLEQCRYVRWMNAGTVSMYRWL